MRASAPQARRRALPFGAAPSARRQKLRPSPSLADGAKASNASGPPQGLGVLPAPAAGVARIPSPSQTTPLVLPGRRRLTSNAGGPQRLGISRRPRAQAARDCSSGSTNPSRAAVTAASTRGGLTPSNASGLTAVSAPSVGPGVTLASAGPSAARTQGAVLGGAKRKAEDAAARSVSAAARGARGLADGAQAHNRSWSAGVGAVHLADVTASFAVGASPNATAAGTIVDARPTPLSPGRQQLPPAPRAQIFFSPPPPRAFARGGEGESSSQAPLPVGEGKTQSNPQER